MMETIEVLIKEEEVAKRIKDIGDQITREYEGSEVHLICILKGGVFFLCELAKHIKLPVTIDFMTVSSYGNETTSSGIVKVKQDLTQSIENKQVIIVEDIIDTGITLSSLMPMLKERKPASLKLCALLDKPERRRKEVKIDYLGFQIPDRFVVGYGLDYEQKYRNLPYIGVVVPEANENH
ncbi:MAG: hypoxanthine phosphoribosyltransferase [Lachnospiraceae bacterium]|nr:hypoxanthine phosphoribosyltransferase [Lachnospiraceae bacterium]MEE1342302.1 hypoxanthine phosphoribosyltransferase [Lachnospiraceae bacterium]